MVFLIFTVTILNMVRLVLKESVVVCIEKNNFVYECAWSSCSVFLHANK